MFRLALFLHEFLRQNLSQCCSLGQLERFFHQVKLGCRCVGRLLDNVYNFINIAYRQNQPFENVRPVSASPQQESASSADDYFAMVDKATQKLLNIQRLRPIINQRHIRYRKGSLEQCISIKFIEYDIRVGIFFQFNHYPQTSAV